MLSNLRLPAECGLICVLHTPIAQTVDYMHVWRRSQLVAVKKQTCSQKVTGFSVDRDYALSFASDPADKSISEHQPFDHSELHTDIGTKVRN